MNSWADGLFTQIDIIGLGSMVIVWRVRGKFVRSVLNSTQLNAKNGHMCNEPLYLYL